MISSALSLVWSSGSGLAAKDMVRMIPHQR
ncbi:MAG: hypothetical protein ACJA09_002997 [Alcanivorax sp.]